MVAVGAVVESRVITQSSLHRLGGWGEGTVAQSAAEMLVGESLLWTHSQLISQLLLHEGRADYGRTDCWYKEAHFGCRAALGHLDQAGFVSHTGAF